MLPSGGIYRSTIYDLEGRDPTGVITIAVFAETEYLLSDCADPVSYTHLTLPTKQGV